LFVACLSPGQFTIPRSAAILNSTTHEPLFLLVGLRQGSILSFKLNTSASEDIILADKRPHLYNIGARAVRLSPSSHRLNNGIYALSDQLWKLTCSKRNRVEMEHILLPKFERTIDAFASFDCGLPLLFNTGEPLAVIVDSKLQVYQLSLSSETNTYKIHLNEVRHWIEFIWLCVQLTS
jgi:hypothetical protein